jgi:L-aspartate oxidase
VCGEASSTGLHGANRLASNGLLEALVFARICAEGIAAQTATVEAPEITFDRDGIGFPPDPQGVAALRQTMTDKVGVVRDGAGLKQALFNIASLQARDPSPSFQNMCATATLIAAAALLREESRGAHERSDFPAPLPGPGSRSMMTYAEAIALRDTLLEGQT